MRWKAKRPVPKPGDVRTIYRFALAPRRVGDELVWLERYGVEQVRVAGFEGDDWNDVGVFTLEVCY